ncbi:TPA: AAA family ATPase [candidate division CPR2 bacterium]|uniref:PIF1 helicase n=1 Tax=candidate division CPR2 bacterium GW2011_GWC1_41_48 TaxID=1618344 RepID=A0A0G0Z9T2_UNCC2|nr:MAG: PIF1 helicase [candidate division CPR2 bacterium GW2011_GWC2_39_35]KKR27019.1 MAG: PIF1 helicase [candidate division CPR2 bacterium GW2011_GWD1_39_7]KKR28144.1 MAG: PIF1 helicase [candidate division CPR2 bacterium GW2011_GWD2_39_7]KKS09798.1 MAG: PIF1 helicase [candidate division CPR2 bacterium GW2011_GWC1_41_48]OGB56529.1 MAG: AAA family ATPase [candidate division CPR2 bacterium GWD1_39_7]OGB72261.1 MAG: AAA family ATPase [candidate division CPR2 bacterium GWD2_39_7]HBG81594.1 AAA fa
MKTPEYIQTTNIELNDQFQRAYNLMENSLRNIFITGKAGTGKSTLLNYFRENTKKKVVVLAPTGVAAINVKGQTIHSFFKFKPDITLAKVKKLKEKKNEKANLYQKIDTIIIDEISMVRADLLDCVDKFLRLNGKETGKPFGGIQMIFVGDLYQLPPVVTAHEKSIFEGSYKSEYFFDAKVFEGSLFEEQFDLDFIELEKIYRQKDNEFINLLSTIRNNTATNTELEALNKRHNPHFKPSFEDYYIYLTTTNKMAAAVNEERLNLLDGKNHQFEGQVTGKFDNKYLPTDIGLKIKMGSQVMLLNNDPAGRWVNGSIGKVVDILENFDSEDVLKVELSSGRVVNVTPFTWEVFNFEFDDMNNSLVSKTVGSFTQYPLKLAWAITIHKSQGKTFEKIIVDIGWGTFAHGQMYVALSRCTSLDGIVLKKSIQQKHIIMDQRVVDFVTNYRQAT